MYVRRLTIEQLRCFEHAELALQYPGREDGAAVLPNVNLLLGNNGAGKTTVLRAVALAILSPVIQSAGFRPYRLVRRAPGKRAKFAEARAEVELHAQDLGGKGGGKGEATVVEDVATRIEVIRDDERVAGATDPTGHWESMFAERSPAFLLVGYGASRRVESASRFDESVRARSRLLRYERVAGLFEEGVTLTPLGAWLPRMRSENPGRHKQVVDLINELLPDECRFSAETERDDFLFELRGVPVPFAALSDGYRAYIGWITDLLYHVTMGAPSGAKLVENRGVVLVDEIDLHLHPEWQRTVVPRLSAALPNLQFVLTTHSPIVAGTLSSRSIFVMEVDENGASTVVQYEENVHGRSAEQILLSPYFNLETTRAPEMEDELASLSKRARSGDKEASLEFMRRLREGLGAADEPPVERSARS
jgi:predicted ATPase